MSTFTNLPLISGFIKSIDKDLENYSFQKTMRNSINRLSSKLVVKNKNKEIEKMLKHKPVVLVANHPYEAEVPVLIAGLPDRDDTSIVVNRRLMNLSSNLDKYLIPVYIDHHFTNKRRHKLMNYVLKAFHPKEKITAEESRKLNIQSVKEAARRVDAGGLVIIFPGKKKTDGHWYSGVGHMLNQTKRKDIYVVRAYIEGTSLLDLFRLIPKIGIFLPTFTLTFAPPLKLTEFRNEDPKKTTTKLEDRYNDWIKTLDKKN